MQSRPINWKVVTVASIVVAVAVGAACGLRIQVYRKQPDAHTRLRFESAGTPVQQIGDWAIY